MSNALSACGALPRSFGSAVGAQKFQIALLAAGVILLLIWIARRAVFPRNVRLSRSPGRANTVELAHIIILLLVWMGVTAGVQKLLLCIARGTGWARLATSQIMTMPTLLLAVLVGQVYWLAASVFVARRTFPLGLSRGLGLSMRHWFYDGVRAVVACLAVLPVCVGLSALFIRLLEPFLQH